MARFRGLIAPVEVPTGDSRIFEAGKGKHRPLPLPLLAKFSSGSGHGGATPVGKMEQIYLGPGGYWTTGPFLDPTKVPEVGKAIYMLNEGVMGPSVDLDQDFTVEMIKHPLRAGKRANLFKEYNFIGATLVPMPAFSQVHLSVENDEERALLASLGIDTTGWETYFDVNSDSWKSWPIAPREYTFDADDAVKRIAYWAGVGSREPDLNKYASAFLWRNGNQMGSTLAQDSFRLPLADIINGTPHLIYHAVYAAAALLSGGHGGLPNIPNEDKQRMVPVINEIYAALSQAYGDANLKSPFTQGQPQQQASIDDNCGCTEEFSEEGGEGPAMENNVNYSTLTIGETAGPVSNVTITYATAKEPYGDVEYADPGYQADGKKRYPLNSEKRCRAAWSYINQAENAEKYSPEDLEKVRGRIISALKEYGVDVSEDAEGESEMSALLAGIAPLAPPAAWFRNPSLKAPTKLTIGEDGRVFGHLAQWKVCHIGIGDKCVIAPKSRTNYKLFRVGTVFCDDGSPVEVGKITLGTGHANDRWGVIPSREHYDNTGWAAAIVNIGEDQHGIWVSGALTTTMDEQRVAELRQSPLSGDWRRVNGNWELVAALAVNNPGFPVYREEAGSGFSLMGVGVVGMDEEDEVVTPGETDIPGDVSTDLVLDPRAERLDAINAEMERHFQAKRAKQLEEISAERETLAQSAESGIIARQMNARFVEVKE